MVLVVLDILSKIVHSPYARAPYYRLSRQIMNFFPTINSHLNKLGR